MRVDGEVRTRRERKKQRKRRCPSIAVLCLSPSFSFVDTFEDDFSLTLSFFPSTSLPLPRKDRELEEGGERVLEEGRGTATRLAESLSSS